MVRQSELWTGIHTYIYNIVGIQISVQYSTSNRMDAPPTTTMPTSNIDKGARGKVETPARQRFHPLRRAMVNYSLVSSFPVPCSPVSFSTGSLFLSIFLHYHSLSLILYCTSLSLISPLFCFIPSCGATSSRGQFSLRSTGDPGVPALSYTT